MKLRLHLPYDFKASHSLAGYEEPHDHLWRCRFSFEGVPVDGKIADIPSLEAALRDLVAPLVETYLNENAVLSESTRSFPTCEALASDLFLALASRIVPGIRAANPSFRLAGVSVALWDATGTKEWGTAEVLP
mgnify:CR=1 FL=1